MKKVSIGAAAVVGTAAILLLAGCGYQQPASTSTPIPTPTTNPMPATPIQSNQPASSAAVQTNAVTIKNFAFSPATITVAKGTKVTWTNEDSVAHQIASDSSSSAAFNGPSMATGQQFSFTFNEAGTFSYHCAIHPSMTAKVIVQ